MFHVRDDFPAKAPITAVPAAWFNKVGKFLNNLIGDGKVVVDKSADSLPVIRLAEKGGGSISGSFPIISEVSWNGSQIVIGHATVSVVNNAFVVTPGASTMINTVTYSN